MFDSLPYRNDAATVFRRLIRSLPTRRGVLGVATCDKGLPAMMMALAGDATTCPACSSRAASRCLPIEGEDAGTVQTIGARFAHGEISLEEAAELGCRACASPGGGCQFLGTAATSQVVGEALGMSLGHSALAPSGHPIWLDMARRSARALMALERRGIRMRDILTDAALHNAMVDARGVRRLDEPDPARPGDRPRRRAAPADRRRLDRRQPARAAPRRRAAERPAASSDGPGVPGRRRARSHAAPAPRGTARDSAR